MNLETSDPMFYVRLGLIFVVAVYLIPVIVEISAAKRTAVGSILSTAFTINGGWELRFIYILVAVLVMISIPSWGLLKILFEDSHR
ncbi:hypothetical protein [Natronoglomus mannanivorans]|uniref:hypothetical protein n=1 Tax=Natronoglomus mannanivorans TaxID=2979990 RepID=UPI003082D98A